MKKYEYGAVRHAELSDRKSLKERQRESSRKLMEAVCKTGVLSEKRK